MEETHYWKGASGKSYLYYIKDIDFNFKEDQNGNYIFCKKIKGVWKAIYIGEGDLEDRTKFRINDGCVKTKGSTHIHAHIENSESDRKKEETDILNNHPESYVPIGCNIKIGG
jgi:hypothetical protein